MRLTRLQGWYYLAGGLWPLLHVRSFQAVAGPKPDRFQTEVTSILFAAIGTALLVGARGPTLQPAVRTLAVASALGTAYMDLKHRRQLRMIFQPRGGTRTRVCCGRCRRSSSQPEQEPGNLTTARPSERDHHVELAGLESVLGLSEAPRALAEPNARRESAHVRYCQNADCVSATRERRR